MGWMKWIPKPVKAKIFGTLRRHAPAKLKYKSELDYWQSRWEAEDHALQNSHYQKLMLGMAGREDDGFLAGKIVADFGCGPRGSLCWANAARIRIGIDVLASEYVRLGITTHDMCYVCSTEQAIPLPSNYVDYMFTANALDHVKNLSGMCDEILRILALGGEFIGSFNLNEPPNVCEPQTLTEGRLKRFLLDHLDVTSYRLVARGPDDDIYRHFFSNDSTPASDLQILWVRARKL